MGMANATIRSEPPEHVVLHGVREIRLQVSVVRALLDEVETIEPQFSDSAREHFIQELARLGCQILETASGLSTKGLNVGPRKARSG
jgi:hypothetical protein